MKRFLLVVLGFAMLLAMLTACGKQDGDEDEDEPKEESVLPEGAYWYKKYVAKDNDESKKVLVEEYVNLGTERSKKLYDENGEVIELYKWYYDSTGTRLLKEVVWAEGKPTQSREYDERDRLVLEKIKLEGKAKPGEMTGLVIPITYAELVAGFEGYGAQRILTESAEAEEGVIELKTEYTYFGDTAEIKSMQTTTDRGEVIGSYEHGEGDIILSCKLTGRVELTGDTDGESGEPITEILPWNYEETYDPETGTGTWKENFGTEYTFHGKRDYDDQNRCNHYITYYDYYDFPLAYDTIVEFGDDGFWVTFSRYSYDQFDFTYAIQKFDLTRRIVRDERYSISAETERPFMETIDLYEYHPNGELSRYVHDNRMEAAYDMRETETLYDEEGNFTKQMTDGFLSMENQITVSEDPATGETIRKSVMRYYRNPASLSEPEETYSPHSYAQTETTEVRMPDIYDPSKENWVVISCETMYNEVEREIQVHSYLNEEGLLTVYYGQGSVIIDGNSVSGTCEDVYDPEGRICKRIAFLDDDGIDATYYWEYSEQAGAGQPGQTE